MGCGLSRRNAEVYVPLFNPRLAGAGITSKLRLVHLLAQIIGETHFKPDAEDLARYTAKNLVQLWKRFQVEEVQPTIPGGAVVFKHFKLKKGVPLTTSQLAYAKNFRDEALSHGRDYYAEKLGDMQYGHEGNKYRGRGLLQITHDYNYIALAAGTHNPDYATNPDLLNEPIHAVISALWFWKSHNLNQYADRDDIWSISQIVNIGHKGSHKTKPNGLQDRMDALINCKRAFGLLPASHPHKSHPASPTHAGTHAANSHHPHRHGHHS